MPSIVQCLARKDGTDDFYQMKVSEAQGVGAGGPRAPCRPGSSALPCEQEQHHFFPGPRVNITLPSRQEKPFRFIHTHVGGCAGVAWEDLNPCFSCSSHSAWKSKGCGVLLLCVCLPKILTLEERGDQGIESQEERQGKMLLHTEYSLLSLLHTQDGVVHHHGLFQVSGTSPAPTPAGPAGATSHELFQPPCMQSSRTSWPAAWRSGHSAPAVMVAA